MTDQELVDAHWGYVKGVLVQHGITNETMTVDNMLETVQFHYKTAMLHGIKHGRELERQERIGVQVNKSTLNASGTPYNINSVGGS